MQLRQSCAETAAGMGAGIADTNQAIPFTIITKSPDVDPLRAVDDTQVLAAAKSSDADIHQRVEISTLLDKLYISSDCAHAVSTKLAPADQMHQPYSDVFVYQPACMVSETHSTRVSALCIS